MWTRWIAYLVVTILAIPVVGWLTFGAGLAMPFHIFTWPVEKILWHINPSAGSNPSWELGGEMVLSSVFWLCVAIAVDLGVFVMKARCAVRG